MGSLLTLLVTKWCTYFGLIILKGACTHTTLPRAHSSPLETSEQVKTVFLPVTSLIRARIRTGSLTGVGFKYVTCNDAVNPAIRGSVPSSLPSAR